MRRLALRVFFPQFALLGLLAAALVVVVLAAILHGPVWIEQGAGG